MTLCIKALYRVFPEIKAFGCCHEVFGTQSLLGVALEQIECIKGAAREEIKVNPIGINHFIWLTSAKYRNIDLFPVYKNFVKGTMKQVMTSVLMTKKSIGLITTFLQHTR